jgi:predicted MFS family arabinose efflux permease
MSRGLQSDAGYRALLARPSIARLLTATMLSRLGTRMFTLALVLFMLGRFHSPALAGWAMFFSVAPGLAASPVAAVLLDRVGAVCGIGADLLLTIAILLVLAAFGARLPAGAVLALLAVYSLTSPLNWAGIRATLPRLVPASLWPQVNALDTAIYGIVDIAGPAIAGIAIAAIGAGATFLAIALVLAAALLCLIRVGDIPAAASSRRGLLADVWDGMAHFARHRTLRALALCYALYHAAWGALTILVPVVVTAHLGARGDTGTGLLWGLAGAAGIAGSLVAGHVRIIGRERTALAVFIATAAIAIFPLAAFGGLAGLALALVVLGVASGPIDVALMTLRQRRTAPAWFTRIVVLSMSLNVAGVPLGAAVAGDIAQHSITLAFAVAALAALLGAAAVALIPADAPNPEAPTP